MAHFGVLLLIPKSPAKVEEVVQGLIGPYADYLEVLPYDEPCDCIGDKPDPECPECRGTGIRQSTSNPKGRYDWYVIGGRFAGKLIVRNNPSAVPQHRPTAWGRVQMAVLAPIRGILRRRESMRAVSDLDVPKTINDFWSVVTPDGEWHERGRTINMANDAKTYDEWANHFMELLQKHADCMAVIVDCHR